VFVCLHGYKGFKEYCERLFGGPASKAGVVLVSVQART
jgi:hypothetical protein